MVSTQTSTIRSGKIIFSCNITRSSNITQPGNVSVHCVKFTTNCGVLPYHSTVHSPAHRTAHTTHIAVHTKGHSRVLLTALHNCKICVKCIYIYYPPPSPRRKMMFMASCICLSFCLSLCLSVCLRTNYLKNGTRYHHETLNGTF